MDKVKWRGGSYGELPHVFVGDFCYVIRDEKINGKWEYRLYRKVKNHRNILHKPKNNPLKYLSYGESVFLRWWRLKHKYPPFRESYSPDGKTVVYTDRTLRFKYFVNNESITIYDNGVALDWYYKTIAEAKRKAEPIILEAIKQYEKETQAQLSFFDS
jgi:hypothetical protein